MRKYIHYIHFINNNSLFHIRCYYSYVTLPPTNATNNNNNNCLFIYQYHRSRRKTASRSSQSLGILFFAVLKSTRTFIISSQFEAYTHTCMSAYTHTHTSANARQSHEVNFRDEKNINKAALMA